VAARRPLKKPLARARAKTRAKAKARAPRAIARDEDGTGVEIVLRLAKPRTEIRIDATAGEQRARLQKLALRWAHVVRNRSRWSASPSAEAGVRDRAAADLASLGIEDEQLRRLAESEHVEVSIGYATENDGWEARIFPWEVVITAATKPLRGARSLFVTRHLVRPVESSSGSSPMKVLFVESAPGKLSEHYGFSSERRLILSSLEAKRVEPLQNPSLAELERKVRKFGPQVIHFTGVDLHEGANC
jgi:hypothetical protein